MLSAFANCLKIPELRNRIFFTLSLLFVARVASHIPLPGIDPQPLLDFFEREVARGQGTALALWNMFTGGALLKGAIGALGVMPFISASIIFQLLGAVVPSIARLQQEGDVGRQKLMQYTRYATVVISFVQAILLTLALQNPGQLFSGFDGEIVIISKGWFLVTGTVFLTVGALVMMWLGEQITQRGIGNGISILITIGILGQLPAALQTTWQLIFPQIGVEASINAPQAMLMVGLLIGLIAAMVALTQGQRKVMVQYAKRMVGQKMYGGQSSFLPLKVNYSGVMPVIFAQTILLFPNQLLSYLGAATKLPFITDFANALLPGNWWYYIIKSSMILFFSYFWVSVMFRPIQIADDLKKYGGYVPGVRPGEPTARFLDFIMTRLTLAGAIGLTVIAILPDFLNHTLGVPYAVGVFFGGTGMLITVGVSLDTMRQIETFLLQRHYDGFLRKGRIKGRAPVGSQLAIGQAATETQVMKLAIPLLILFLIGLMAWVIRNYVM
jgi:preprotein translocase subunit SecY